jgi:hypothetical protein
MANSALLSTYFSKKIHLQVECMLMAPPMSGPHIREIAKIPVTRTEYLGYLSGGTISKMTINARE